MRLIDADDLKTKFNKDNFMGFVITKIIDMQPTIDPDVLRPQWIPTAERLPADGQYVLITQREQYPGQAEEGEFHTVVEAACFSCNCWIVSELEAYFADEDIVYAWMPLPEPYEPDGAKMEAD